eukprot:Mrub_04753.p1 GENE.Mrub_04753~~Mrub_04753.p1  ORF type:complete len:395 (+),score=18.13 Mrub_04753:82-1185(+)
MDQDSNSKNQNPIFDIPLIHKIKIDQNSINVTHLSNDSNFIITGSSSGIYTIISMPNKYNVRTTIAPFSSRINSIDSIKMMSNSNVYYILVATQNLDAYMYMFDQDTSDYIDNTRIFYKYTNKSPIYTVKIFPDLSQLILAGEDGIARLFNLHGVLLHEFNLNYQENESNEYINSMDVDNNYIYSKSANTIYSIDVHPDSNKFVSGHHDGIARAWSKHNPNAVVCSYTGHQGSIMSVHISRDGSYLLTGGQDGVAHLYEFYTGKLMMRYGVNGEYSNVSSESILDLSIKEGITTVIMSKDNSWIFAGSKNGYVYMWNTYTGRIISKFYDYSSKNLFVNSIALYDQDKLCEDDEQLNLLIGTKCKIRD